MNSTNSPEDGVQSESTPVPASTAASAPKADASQSGADKHVPKASKVSTRKASSRQGFIYVALLILALLLAAQWWFTNQQLSHLRSEVAQRMQSGDSINTETRVLAKSIDETTQALQAKVNVLENKQSETQNQQVAFEQLYQDLFKRRDDWVLSGVEQTLSVANQQLQLASNVAGALIALENADARLSRDDVAQFINVRRAIAHDIERLKALPNLDMTGIALRLDSVIDQIDNMPLLSDERPVESQIAPKNAALPKQSKSDEIVAPTAEMSTAQRWALTFKNKWQSFSTEMWGDIQQLVRVREVNNPDALLLSPTQAFYARENLKLRLLSARLGLLSRNESAFRSDMVAAQETINRYFDTRAKQTQNMQAMLKQIQTNKLSIDLPTLDESLSAVRNYKAKP
tara:strand:- start:353096 stop:354298 length:1203 start_codon:yes stop_codon:yes gene_type:complete